MDEHNSQGKVDTVSVREIDILLLLLIPNTKIFVISLNLLVHEIHLNVPCSFNL